MEIKEIENAIKYMSLDEKIAYTNGYRDGMMATKEIYNPKSEKKTEVEPTMSPTGHEEVEYDSDVILSPAERDLRMRNLPEIEKAKQEGRRVCMICANSIEHQPVGEDTCESCAGI